METLSKLTVAEAVLLLLPLTARPMYTFWAMLMVWVAPTCTQFTPSAEVYPLKVLPLRTSLTQ
jgi:Tfp pilus assembly protein PilZ